MSALVSETKERLALDIKDRRITWRIQELPPASGDPVMMRLVFENLLSNAVKYTRNRPEAVIEIGARRDGGEIVYFVRDNGVGFDMAYVNKLFGVFQRLHRIEEFEGTGIGLANVRRIVERHGGRAWAEGALDRGATFFFALPDTDTH
jgi:light-regulated signal transduction histidine kinase (bacteriophytochrome)